MEVGVMLKAFRPEASGVQRCDSPFSTRDLSVLKRLGMTPSPAEHHSRGSVLQITNHKLLNYKLKNRSTCPISVVRR
jgi:hypothetical protein